MSEKQQGTAQGMRLRMHNRYDDGLEHKHNKNHVPFRRHFKTHPVQTINGLKVSEEGPSVSTGSIREVKLRKVRKRALKGNSH